MDNDITDEAFDELITRAMDELPQEYIKGLENVAILYADEPDEHQRQNSRIGEHDLLLGLFEGIPKTHRSSYASFALPDKITLFKYPLLAVSKDEDDFFSHVKRTLWHEIAHYYGLDHDHIHKLERGSA